MKRSPSLFTVKDLVDHIRECSVKIDSKWMPARPLGLYSIRNRFRLAWLVFTGKCDALKWPGGQ